MTLSADHQCDERVMISTIVSASENYPRRISVSLSALAPCIPLPRMACSAAVEALPFDGGTSSARAACTPTDAPLSCRCKLLERKERMTECLNIRRPKVSTRSRKTADHCDVALHPNRSPTGCSWAKSVRAARDEQTLLRISISAASRKRPRIYDKPPNRLITLRHSNQITGAPRRRQPRSWQFAGCPLLSLQLGNGLGGFHVFQSFLC